MDLVLDVSRRMYTGFGVEMDTYDKSRPNSLLAQEGKTVVAPINTSKELGQILSKICSNVFDLPVFAASFRLSPYSLTEGVSCQECTAVFKENGRNAEQFSSNYWGILVASKF